MLADGWKSCIAVSLDSLCCVMTSLAPKQKMETKRQESVCESVLSSSLRTCLKFLLLNLYALLEETAKTFIRK